MAIPKFTSKDPAETVLITFDFSNLFADITEIISGVVWSVEVTKGIDASASSMLTGVSTVSSNAATHLIMSGVAGNIYAIHCVATTNKNQILKLSGSMEIKVQV
jgi:hypothetical protein